MLLPPCIGDYVPEEHLARLVIETVDHLDLSCIVGSYNSDGMGGSAIDPKAILETLIYAYAHSITSSRDIETLCREKNQPILDVPQPPSGRGVQRLLPIFPAESTAIAEGLAVLRANGRVKYYTGLTPVFTHKEEDEASFRMYTAQLCAQGTCCQMDC